MLDRPRNVMVTNVSLNTSMVTWDNVCDSISSVDKLSVTGYSISWYNSARGIIDDILVPSSCKDSKSVPYITNFTSNLSIQFLSVSVENPCGRGEATNIVVNGMLILAFIISFVYHAMLCSNCGHCGVLLDICTYQRLHS